MNNYNNTTKLKIAVTGGIGSGKSFALQYIASLDFPVFSCDEIYKQVILSKEYIEKIQQVFPECVIGNQINRKKLAEIVFSNDAQMKQLNNIAHPLIMEQLFNDMARAQANLVFAEVPLLFEEGYEDQFDFVFIIQRSLEERIESVKKRDGLSQEEILRRIRSQFDYSQISTLDYYKNPKFIIIENTTDIEGVKVNLHSAINQLEKAVCET